MFKTENVYQNDENWKSVALGNQAQETIESWGCLLTSMTMVLNGLGFKETPASVNTKMKAAGGFQGAMVMPASLPQAFPGVVFKGYDPCESAPAPISQIDSTLSAGKPVIVQVDWNPQDGVQSHWIVLKEKKGSDYVMYDPYRYGGDSPDKELMMLDRYFHSGKDVAKAITAVVWLESDGPSAPPAPKVPAQVPAGALKVYGTADGLAMRGDPSVGGYLMKRLPLTVELTVLDDPAAAKAKVGQMNQWLHVQEPDKEQGYIAAWYVADSKAGAKESGAEPAAPAAPAPASSTTAAAAPAAKPAASPAVKATGSTTAKAAITGFTVKPTTDGLAFRSQPTLGDDTLIKRLPLSATLKVLEPAVAADKKLGVNGQWLNVQDITGKKGFVAAWYVSATDNPALGVSSASDARPTAGSDVVVRSTADGLALRSQPAVADTNLIKRLPLRAELILVNPAEAAVIGVQNKWLKVKDVDEEEGFVAAWYVGK